MQWIKAAEEKMFLTDLGIFRMMDTFLLHYLSSDLFWLAKVAEIYLSKNISSNIFVLN